MSKYKTKITEELLSSLSYKRATEFLLEQINEELKFRNETNYLTTDVKKFTFKNIDYSGDYSEYVKFNIEEIPGWKFGIWWNETKDSRKDEVELTGKFFCQFEETIDKFRPNRSELCEDFNNIYLTNLTNLENGGIPTNEICDMLFYIINEPELAFCRDVYYWGKYEYHTRAEAKKKFTRYLDFHKKELEINKRNNEAMIQKIKEIIKKDFNSEDAFIYNYGPDYFPQYELVINKDKFEQFKDDNYGLYSFSYVLPKESHRDYRKLLKECDKLANKEHIFWEELIDTECVFFVGDDKFKKMRTVGELK